MKIYYPKKLFKFTSEIILLVGELEQLSKEDVHCYNYKNESRYDDAFKYAKKNIEYSSIDKCDIVCLPYKFKYSKDQNLIDLNNLSKKYGKKVLVFYNDDDDKQYVLEDNIIMFRTSFYKSKRFLNEYAMIPFFADNFRNLYLVEPKLSIGYCGHLYSGRKRLIEILRKSELKCDFIIRNGYWAPGIDKKTAVNDFYGNIEDNLYNFCYRGGGNFSYRFYQTLMMGRIPILFDSDQVLAFDDIINYSEHCLIISKHESKVDIQIINEIKKWHEDNKNNLLNIQYSNRKLWEEKLSGKGFINQIINRYS